MVNNQIVSNTYGSKLYVIFMYVSSASENAPLSITHESHNKIWSHWYIDDHSALAQMTLVYPHAQRGNSSTDKSSCLCGIPKTVPQKQKKPV